MAFKEQDFKNLLDGFLWTLESSGLFKDFGWIDTSINQLLVQKYQRLTAWAMAALPIFQAMVFTHPVVQERQRPSEIYVIACL